MTRRALSIAVLALLLAPPAAAFAQVAAGADTAALAQADQPQARGRARGDVLADAPDWPTQVEQLAHAAARLPIAAGLACVLALRPRRRGTPPRQLPVIQTQIILAIVGAVVMLVVGSSLARAFGIVGAAGLVRYRAKIADPKDAGVMLSTLAIGLASGVGLWLLAVFGTAFILAVLWIVESFEPKAVQRFTLRVKTHDPPALKPRIEALLERARIAHSIRTTSPDELCYEVKLPIDRNTDRLSNAILALDANEQTTVEWEDKE